VGLVTVFYCLRFETSFTTRRATVEVFDPAATQNSQLRQSESYVTTDSQSASLSWNKVTIWGSRADSYYCQRVARLLMRGALSDKRTGVSFARVTVKCNKSVLSMYNLNLHAIKCMYIQHIQGQYSGSCPIISSSCYNSSLVTWLLIILVRSRVGAQHRKYIRFLATNVPYCCVRVSRALPCNVSILLLVICC
jgi:hypothetical protein